MHLLAQQGDCHCEILRGLCCLHGNYALSSTMVSHWMTATFTSRRNFTEKPVGRPPKLTPAVLRNIRDATCRDPTITILQLSRQFQLEQVTIHKPLWSVLKLCKYPCVLCLHKLLAANCWSQLQISQHLLSKMRHSPRWSSKVITADKSWMYVYNPT